MSTRDDLGIREGERPAITIRPATVKDLDAIEAIEQRAFSDPWTKNSFATLIGERAAYFAVATASNAVIGYVAAWFIGGDGEIGNIAVDRDWRGRGIGTRLLDAALEAAREIGVEVMYLEVRESNDAARRMYERCGFIRVGRRRRYYRRPEEDALILRLVLHPTRG